MNLNQKCFKTVNSAVNSLHICWNLDVTFTLCQARSHGGIQGQCPEIFLCPTIFLCPEKFVLNTYRNKHKNLAPVTVYSALRISKPGYKPALCQPTL